MLVIDRTKPIPYEPTVAGANSAHVKLEKVNDADDIVTYRLSIPKTYANEKLSVQWKLANVAVKGTWSSTTVLDKRYRTDWELPQVNSSIYSDLPIFCLFGYQDENVLTVACSDAVNELQMKCALREEDNHFYCSLHFCVDSVLMEDYSTCIYIDERKIDFSKVVMDARDWIVNTAKIQLAPVPNLAKKPVYSTWYTFHQHLEKDSLIAECKEAKSFGYDVVIIDDGWQTNDGNRGYDYTGDWEPERFEDLPSVIANLQELGMSVMLWFSVPFCGIKSNAYKHFKGKFLTENHHWAPVLDPRFSEVREYLVGKYVRAIREWKLDGLKLDFIDDFKVYPETEIDQLNGRDTLSVAQGCNTLIQEIKQALYEINPDVLIEFRQKYISPALASLGNMFRAFDCPNDPLMNRVRTTDVKLICGQAAVHSDMLTWSSKESVEHNALQFTSILFSVPQLSVRLAERSAKEKQMILFFTYYWLQNEHVLLSGKFIARGPLSNYHTLEAVKDDKQIIGVYDEIVILLNNNLKYIDIINGKMTRNIYFSNNIDIDTTYIVQIVNCLGEDVTNEFEHQSHLFTCPPNGIIKLTSK